MPMRYDDIIIGGGSSGAAPAARLTEDPQRAVLLLEAGPDFATVEQMPPSILRQTSVAAAAFDWGYQGTIRGREVGVPRGKVIGGSSAINGAIALLGVPDDYDEWAALGNDGWAWRDVLDTFRRLEDDRDEGGDFHGSGGPIPVCRARDEETHPVQAAFRVACLALGFPESADMNHPNAPALARGR